MNIYIDELFLINMLINFLLLISSSKLSGENLDLRRAAAAAALGGIYSVGMAFPNLKIYTNFICRFMFSMIMLVAAFGIRKSFLKIFLGFYAAMFVFAGITVVFMNMGMKAVIYNGNLYFDFPIGGFIFVSALITYIINRIGTYFKSLLIKKGIHCDILIKYKDKIICTEGIFDTGNFLCDPISRKPVAVADINTLHNLFEEDFLSAVIKKDYATALTFERSYLIPYSTVGHKTGFLFAVKPDVFQINGKEARVMLGIANTGRGIIINPNITETGVFTK